MAPATNAPQPRRDYLLVIAVVGAVALLIAAAIPAECAVSLMGRYHSFVQDLGESLMYAREHGTLEASVDGQAHKATLQQVEHIYGRISDAGMGKPLDNPPKGNESLAFAFGDGSTLQLFPAKIEQSGKSAVEGLAVCFQRSDGRTFAYDTDRLSYQALLNDFMRTTG